MLRVTVLSRVRDPCHFTRNYGSSAHTDCNTKLKLNHKILILLHKLKETHRLMFQQSNWFVYEFIVNFQVF